VGTRSQSLSLLFYLLLSLFFSPLAVDKLEDVVVDKVASALGVQEEGLAVVHRLWLIIDNELTSDQDDDGIVGAWLGVQRGDLVHDFLEGQLNELVFDGRGSEGLARLERQHRLVSIESL